MACLILVVQMSICMCVCDWRLVDAASLPMKSNDELASESVKQQKIEIANENFRKRQVFLCTYFCVVRVVGRTHVRFMHA